MNRSVSIHGLSPVYFFLALLLVTVTCDKPQAPTSPQQVLLPSDKVAPSPVGTTQNVLQKTFSLKTSANFSFEIPAHAVSPHLHGVFASFVGEVRGVSDDAANIDFLIVDQEQYANLVGNRPSEALMSVEASHNQTVNLDLPASLDQPAKYDLVFRNNSRNPKSVEANFRVDF